MRTKDYAPKPPSNLIPFLQLLSDIVFQFIDGVYKPTEDIEFRMINMPPTPQQIPVSLYFRQEEGDSEFSFSPAIREGDKCIIKKRRYFRA
jgi:hypothetical protein